MIKYSKSHMGFKLVQTVVTLNDLERRNGRYIALFIPFWVPLRQNGGR